MLTVLRKLCGQSSTEPSDVFDQSKSRMRAAISPPPWRNAELDCLLEGRSFMSELCRTGRRGLFAIADRPYAFEAEQAPISLIALGIACLVGFRSFTRTPKAAR